MWCISRVYDRTCRGLIRSISTSSYVKGVSMSLALECENTGRVALRRGSADVYPLVDIAVLRFGGLNARLLRQWCAGVTATPTSTMRGPTLNRACIEWRKNCRCGCSGVATKRNLLGEMAGPLHAKCTSYRESSLILQHREGGWQGNWLGFCCNAR